jgi:negative regulator of sigma-B (phosphoserine phosphatase)
MTTLKTENVEAYVFQEAKVGNRVCGDSYYLHSGENFLLCAIADGLGNGPHANLSAQVVPNILKEYSHESIDELLSRCN